MTWDRPEHDPYLQEILPHPSINVVIQPDGARVWGVPTRRDVRSLTGCGWAVGAKFRPGAFTALTGIDAWRITDASMPVEAAFGTDLSPGPNHAASSAAIEALFGPRAITLEPAAAFVSDVIENLDAFPPNAHVEDIAAAHHVAPRTLQKRFRRYVGVGPKWVLKRVRIHNAAQRLTDPEPPRWTELALDLGYYDHAHFIRDFRDVAGRSPAEYARDAASGR